MVYVEDECECDKHRKAPLWLLPYMMVYHYAQTTRGMCDE
jgi:hypothetical protein